MHFSALSDVEALAILSSIPQLGSIKIRLLINYFGSPQEALKAEPDQLAELPGFGAKILTNWKNRYNSDTWKKNLDLAHKYQTELVSYTDPRFPKRLLEITDHPVLLYIKGKVKPSDQYSLAIVGTRAPSIYGQEMSSLFGEELARMGFTIVSGLARGVDTLAHRGALKAGRTIAVIGSGLANLYPRENGELAEAIASKGSLISEFSMLTPPDRQNFPQRNRIVSGMTMGTILIEAPIESGAMITMNKAYRQNRKTFAIPGRVEENFRGNHFLIKNGRALLVENAEEIARHFNTLFGPIDTLPPIKKEQDIPLDREEEQLCRLIPSEETSFDAIYRLSKLPASKLNVLLMSLVLKKAIKEFPGKIYKKSQNGH